MTDSDSMAADLGARRAQLRQQRDSALVGLGRLDGMIAMIDEVLAGLAAPPIAPAAAPATEREATDATAT